MVALSGTRIAAAGAFIAFAAPAVAQSSASITPPPSSASTSTPTSTSITAVSECHHHGSDLFCVAGTAEYQVVATSTPAGVTPTGTSTAAPTQFTNCATRDGKLWCAGPQSVLVQLKGEDSDGDTDGDHDHDHGHDHGSEHNNSTDTTGQKCHVHAGVEHCVPADQIGDEESSACDKMDRNYNIPLRVGLLFVVLATSMLGVFLPMMVSSFSRFRVVNLIFVFLTQFGTGVIFSTALVHLLTHSTLLFSSKCVGELAYEATPAAIAMAGLFLSFLIEYIGERYIDWRKARSRLSRPDSGSSIGDVQPAGHSHHHHHPDTDRAHELLSVMVLEGGIIFHSINSFFIILFIVTIFHQVFEGIALGSRIAALPSPSGNQLSPTHTDDSLKADGGVAAAAPATTEAPSSGVSRLHKIVLCLCFAFTTPIGMAIGIGVLNTFNGNNRATAIAIATLNAFSAGILLWSGIVEMWAHDWLHGGPLARAGPVKTAVGLVGLVAGAVLMSLLGKWI